MNQVEQKRAAKEFVKRWKAEKCVEEEHSRSFWIELLQQVLGIPNATHHLEFERKVAGRKIDVFYEDMGILVEMKGRGISLDEATVRSKKAGPETPYQQAKWYADNLPYSIRPRWIITCNFDEMRIYDQEQPEEGCTQIFLDDLPEQLYLLSFFTDKSNSRLTKEKELSIKAGELVGKLYDELSKQYHNLESDKREQYSLNVVIVRLVFLLYAEDAGLLQKHGAFYDYMKGFDVKQSRQALIDLFKVLNTPDGKNGTENLRDPYLDDDLAAFPYVNGGLFADENIIVPQLTDEIRVNLLLNASAGFDWSGISPTIFGAVFESTLNPETRRSGGMHYTSIENIHKVIDPLFLDDLKDELTAIEGESVEKKRNMMLRMFQRKLASIKVLDPACGSGNFLTETYICLRKLENRVLADLNGDQTTLGLGTSSDDSIMVSIDQLYGIEINDFAVAVAKTALWIAESQAMEETQEVLFQVFDFLPLKNVKHIHLGNALRMDWNDVLPAQECTYIIGNPPFLGYTYQNPDQKADVASIWVTSDGNPVKGAGKLDYVTCWYMKAADYIVGQRTRCAFVSTNSICQGEQVPLVWRTLEQEKGVHIDFAWPTFVWSSEASDIAHVHVVIVGFSSAPGDGPKRIYRDSEVVECAEVSPYLVPGSSVYVEKAKKPLCDAPAMSTGNRPADGGNLIIEDSDLEGFLAKEPEAERWVRPLLGSREFINAKRRWCLWLKDATEEDIEALPLVNERVELCREDRLAAPDAGRRKLASTPHLFREQIAGSHDYLVIPKVSSERREYVPIGYVSAETICTDLLFIVPDGELYHFGVLASQTHNAWMRMVAGRLESRYRYSQDLVYNTFPWPEPTNTQRQRIETCAQAVLNAREAHPGKSLADLYDPDKMPADLLAAHKALDAAVEAAYGVDFQGNEEKIVAHLFKLYAELTEGEGK